MFQGSDWEKVMNRFSQDRQLMGVHEAFVDFISGRARYDQPNPFASGFFGLDFANGFEEEDEYTDDDSDFEDRRDRRPYCGFNRNFLGHGPPRPRSPCLPRPSYKLGSQVKQIMYEEADKNAKELVEEEERRKIKAEKKRLKKLRQKERKRQEKEKENASKNKDSECPEAEDSVMKSNSSNSDIVDCKKDNKKTSVPPDTGPDFPVEEKPARSAHVENNTSSSKPCEDDDDEDDDDEESDEESIASEPEVLDMSSCFVSKAATIAKRKMELKAKSDKKEEKKGSTRSTRKQEQQQQQQQQHSCNNN
ncbi:hypothetical protein AGOR_G00190770 [Albula goreensis]|uniref:Uncharacterized protein n=1 Tax=Albula goreensis TaxID=1534307 RepID=A0A8T3CV52_9TELE|nr:hypothetical protein AGOR_G00190770 [Albula goreensis]